jgi:hypothetical protein
MTVMKKNIEYIAPQVEEIIAVTCEVLCSSNEDSVTFEDKTGEDSLNW